MGFVAHSLFDRVVSFVDISFLEPFKPVQKIT